MPSRMRTLLITLSLAVATACGGAQHVSPSTAEVPHEQPHLDRHRVMVLGTPEVDDAEALAQWHATLPELLERSDAEVLLVDVAADRVEPLRALSLSPATSSERDFVDVVGPWATEHEVEVVPISAWTDEAIRDAADYARRFPHGPLERAALSRRAMYMAALIEHGGGLDVAWLNGADYAALSADAERFAALYNAEDRAEAGLFRIAARTLAHIEDALGRLEPTRVLIVVPSSARFFVVDGLEVLENIVLIEPDRLFD